MLYIASYFTDILFTKRFQTLDELKKYNKENNIKNHNLHYECSLKDIVKDGIVVCLEGDDELEDSELQETIQKYDNFLFLNNLYENPNQLNQLKDKNIDVLIIQSTGFRKEEIDKMQKMYIQHIGNYPKNIVCVLGEEDEFLYPLIKSAPFKINVFSYEEVVNENIIISKWLGTEYMEQNNL